VPEKEKEILNSNPSLHSLFYKKSRKEPFDGSAFHKPSIVSHSNGFTPTQHSLSLSKVHLYRYPTTDSLLDSFYLADESDRSQ
jgi:hypothetical protein